MLGIAAVAGNVPLDLTVRNSLALVELSGRSDVPVYAGSVRPMVNPPVTAAIIIIGNEILSGKVTDLNSPYLSQELRYLGVDLQRIITIPDEMELIGKTVQQYSQEFTWVFTSGGIGPTHDDMTMSAIAQAFGEKLDLGRNTLNVC